MDSGPQLTLDHAEEWPDKAVARLLGVPCAIDYYRRCGSYLPTSQPTLYEVHTALYFVQTSYPYVVGPFHSDSMYSYIVVE